MKVDIQDAGTCRKTLRIEIPKEDVKAELDKVYEEVRTTALIPGFRKGRAPRNVLKMRFNEYIKGEAIEKLVLPAFDKAIKDANLEVLRPAQPGDVKPSIDEIKVSEEEPLVFEVTVDVKPEIIIPELSSLEVEKTDVNVTKEEVDKYLDELRQERASYIPVEDKPVEKGHYVTLTITATSGSEILKEQIEQVLEASEDMTIPEILEHLIGMKIGEEKDFSISFPSDYKAKESTYWQDVPLAGKEVNFHIVLHKITEKVLPALDDDFAKDLGEEDMQHLTASIWNQLVEVARVMQRARQERELMDQLLERSQFDVPDFLIEDQVNTIIRREKLEARIREANPEEAIEKTTQDRDLALKMIKEAWILNEIGELENVNVSDEDIDARIEEMAQSVDRDPQKYRKLLEDTNRINDIRTSIWTHKIFDLLIQKASQKRASSV